MACSPSVRDVVTHPRLAPRLWRLQPHCVEDARGDIPTLLRRRRWHPTSPQGIEGWHHHSPSNMQMASTVPPRRGGGWHPSSPLRRRHLPNLRNLRNLKNLKNLKTSKPHVHIKHHDEVPIRLSGWNVTSSPRSNMQMASPLPRQRGGWHPSPPSPSSTP